MRTKDKYLLDKAKALINRGDHRSAERVLRKIVPQKTAEPSYLLGVIQYHNRNYKKAEKHLLSALAHSNPNTELLHAASTVALALGKRRRALGLSSRAIRNNATNITSINHHATILINNGNTTDAAALLRRSIRICNNQPTIKMALASIYEKNDAIHLAIPLLEEVVESQPNDFEIAKYLANLYLSANSVCRATHVYVKFIRSETHRKSALPLLLASLSSIGKHRRILKIINAIEKEIPFNEQLLTTKISILNSLGRHTEAISCLLVGAESLQGHSKVLRVLDDSIDRSRLGAAELIEFLVEFPKNGYAQFKLGKLASGSGNYDLALTCFINALTFIPGLFDAYLEAFRLLTKSGDKIGALLLAAKMETLFTKSSKIDFLKGYAHLLAGDWDLATDYLNSCLAQEPRHCKANALLGDIWDAKNNPGLALQYYKNAFDSGSSHHLLAGKLAHGMLKMCDWSNLESLIETVVIDTLEHGGVCHPFQAHSLCDDAEFHKICSERLHPILVPPQRQKFPWANQTPARRKKIRVGYISSDFRVHPVAHHMLSILRNHSRENFEIYAISLINENSTTQRQLIDASEHFSSVEFLDDKKAIEFIRSLELDIAVDLNGNTGESRTALFSNRIAHIQINYLGFLGTMGCDFMDYIIADKTLIPESDQRHYSESVIYLKSYQCNTPRPENLPVPQRVDYKLPDRSFIFASFNNTYKINPFVLNCWSKILNETNDSCLWIYIKHAEAKDNFIREANFRGIRTDQIIFAEFAPYDEHLSRHRLADLYLDTFPYSAGATAGNALKMGLPIVTLVGKSFPSRYSASLLESLQLSELVCETPDDYIKKAIELAQNRDRLSSIKESLARNLRTSTSFDPYSFTRNLEEAYTVAVDNYFNGVKDHIYT